MGTVRKGSGNRSGRTLPSDSAVEAALKRGYATPSEREALQRDVEKEANRSQATNTRRSLHDGPPPQKGPGMAVARQRHREAMAENHTKAQQSQATSKGQKTILQKGQVKKEVIRSR